MNACEKAYLQMNLLLDDMLEPEQQKQLQTHLETCAQCRETYARLRAMTCLLREEQEPVPETLHTSVMAAVQREREKSVAAKQPKQPRIYPKRLMKVLGSLAACAAVVLFVRAVLPGSKSLEYSMDANGTASMNRPAVSPDNAEGFLYDMTGDDADYGYGELPPETPESSPAPTPGISGEAEKIEESDKNQRKVILCEYYAEGSRAALPAWAEETLEQCVVDDAVFDCVDVQIEEAEERLNDLTDCGFLLEKDMTDMETPEADSIRILFRWQEEMPELH